ncbi:hypothetical protein [Anaeromyxobacter sp. Fw109-5]|uniref:hypothetical protein n=1 Tax=Anaeromyxobacter sp. (strain Fw109-5) TaxID=404589 RepID=UPI000322CF7E|nr:hypothetical protein [Anaeromyxobacter sp. Fw109-5]
MRRLAHTPRLEGAPPAGLQLAAVRQGLTELAVLTAALVALAAGAVVLYGDELRSALGVRPPPAARAAAPGAAP